MKSIQIQQVNEDIFNQDLFGIKYKITSKKVELFKFTPSLINPEEYSQNHSLLSKRNDLNLYQVYLVSPFIFPLRTSLNGFYVDCMFHLSEILKRDEFINFIWLFQKRNNWKETALDMYKSYLEGNENPTDVDIARKIFDKVYGFVNRYKSNILSKERSIDIENKILDDGYLFQCTFETNLKDKKTLSLIQGIFSQYDFYNSLYIEKIEYKYPYTLYPTRQLLGKSELMSIFCKGNVSIGDLGVEANETPIEKYRTLNKEPVNNHKGEWNDRVKILPHIIKEEIKQDETIVPRLADALKRTGVIKQARLYNESIEYGSRLIIIHADIPKNKNFTDVERKRKDIQAALGIHSLSIEQGDEAGTIKYSIPSQTHQIVSLRELIEREDFYKYSKEHELAFIVGVDETNNPIYLSLKELRHILITGSQGSGKSVFVNQLLTTLLITHSPEELNFILIDPKQVELHQYEKFPHVQEVITNMSKAVKSFNNLIKEMDDRYKLFAKENVKDLQTYNRKSENKKPYIACVVEEWADLFSVAGKDAEQVVLRLGQMARAAGIFLVIVTQRPSAKILSGDIKANIQNKFSFNLGTNTNYKTVFDQGIPFQLLGRGDGVFSIESYHKEFQRFQSPMLAEPSDEEEVYKNLAKTYKNQPLNEKTVDEINNDEDIENKHQLLDELKRLIATTRETKTTVLREKLGIKSNTLSTLLQILVNEGWLAKHRNPTKGYQLIASDYVLEEWRD